MNAEKNNTNQAVYPVEGMSCAACATSVEKVLGKTAGVKSAQVNFASNSVFIEYDQGSKPQAFKEALNHIGFDLILEKDEPLELREEQRLQKLQTKTLWSAALTLPVFVIGMFFMDWEWGKWLSFFLAMPILFYFGKDFYLNAWKQLKNRSSNMDTLVALSTGIAFIYSSFNLFYPQFWLDRGVQPHLYFEAATVIVTFISFGKYLEEKAKSKTTSSIKKLMNLEVKSVAVDLNGKLVEVPLQQVQVGHKVILKPGAKVPVDGVVVNGSSYIDESMISGEPIPVAKQVGDQVFSGTINQYGSLTFRAEKVGKDTFLSRVIEYVQKAQGSKAPIQKLVDKVAAVFVPTVLVIATITFFAWLFIGGQDTIAQAIKSTVTVLVIACPCALGLATPTAIMAGIGKGAEHNILIKSAESLEIGNKVDSIILDKTGTLTVGTPKVQEAQWLDENTYYKGVLYSIESKAEHPLAQAITHFLENKEKETVDVKDFEIKIGFGASAWLEEVNQKFFVGNEKYLQQQGISIELPVEDLKHNWEQKGWTVVFFASEAGLLASFAIADELKPNVRSTIRELKTQGIEVHMLTGDSQASAGWIAEQAGIENFKASMLPQEKANFVSNLQSKGKTVAMVGDGINDSQALAQADVSIAMGKGSDIAMDVAQITLLGNDLERIPQALKLSKRTVAGIRQNLFWAFIYNLIGIPLAAGVLYPSTGFLLNPMVAGAAMALSSVSVVGNSLRLRNVKL